MFIQDRHICPYRRWYYNSSYSRCAYILFNLQFLTPVSKRKSLKVVLYDLCVRVCVCLEVQI